MPATALRPRPTKDPIELSALAAFFFRRDLAAASLYGTIAPESAAAEAAAPAGEVDARPPPLLPPPS